MANDEIGWTLPAFLDRLVELNVTYSLARFRDSIAVLIAVPGERWEVEFMDDGSIEVERFRSSGEILDARSLDELFDRAT